MSGNGRNMYVFRDGRRSVPGPSLLLALAARLRELSPHLPLHSAGRNLVIDILLRAGELECALTDAGAAEAARIEELTDYAAALLIGLPVPPRSSAELLELLPAEVPDVLHLSPPEGFAYYALHPLDFADLARAAQLTEKTALVVGIRSIGLTLSAIVRASLLAQGISARRISVRPSGHPYDRHTEFSAAQLRAIAEARAHEAEFLVVDEGPGMSGSSFLSVGEALLAAGVARPRIRFLCSRRPDINSLCAHDAARRWSGFCACYAASASHLPEDAGTYIGGGYWRHELLGQDVSRWPASWSQMERLKFLSRDRRTVYKFEGFGRFGAEVQQRAQLLAEAGYASPTRGNSVDGFIGYELVEGRSLLPGDLSRGVLERMADYCAFRARAFACDSADIPDGLDGAPHLPGVGRFGSDGVAQMDTMLRFNLAEEFGVELNGDLGSLESPHPVLADGRMLPHEWVQGRDGRLLKCDATSHGDDHFFPGPATDICWDLAGAIVEWRMPDDAIEFFLDRYERASGDRARRRLPVFLLGYTVFRLGYNKMAAAVMCGSEEEQRLLDAYGYYRERASALLPQNVLLAAG